MEVVEFGPLTDAYRAELEGDEIDPFDAAGNSLQWRRKDRHVALRGGDGRLVASAGLVLTEIRIGDDRVVPVVGIGGVIVTAAHRGCGLAREVLEAALARAAALGPPLVLLFCLPDRAGLYERFGFTAVARPVLVTQPEGLAEMPLVTMWRALTPGDELPDGSVTLLGLPY